jgi:hypothetical protein
MHFAVGLKLKKRIGTYACVGQYILNHIHQRSTPKQGSMDKKLGDEV